MSRVLVTLTLLATAVWLGGCIKGDGGIGDGKLVMDASRPSKYPGPFTIYCCKFIGPDRNELVARHLLALDRFGMPKGNSIREPGGTALCYGTYTKLDSPLAKKDLEALRRVIYGDSRRKSFPEAAMVPVIRPLQEYFPLAKARKDALYSLMIAVFSGPQREGYAFHEVAVMLARSLREQGKQEAYVHHGVTSSAVCLGAYDPEAIYIELRMPSLSSDPQDITKTTVTTDDLARRTKIVDPKARALQKKFPHMLINGRRKSRWMHSYKDSKFMRQGLISPTVFVKIPGRKVNRHGDVIIGRTPE